VVYRDPSREQIGEVYRNYQAFEPRKISSVAGCLPDLDIFGDQSLERVDRKLSNLGAKAVAAQRPGNAFLQSVLDPDFPEVDNRGGKTDEDNKQDQPDGPAGQEAGNGRKMHFGRLQRQSSREDHSRFTGSTSTATKTSSGNGRTARVC
jgi:hypothetical protein